MRNLLAVVAMMIVATLASAQGFRYQNQVVASGGLSNPTVRVCTEPASGTPCGPLASIYQDKGLTQQVSNPFVGDANGNFFFYASGTNTYHVQISGPGFPTMDISDILLSGSNGPAASTPPILGFSSVTFSSSPSFNASSAQFFAMTLSGNVGNSTVTGATAGQIISFELCQNGTGGFGFVWPTNFFNPPAVASFASNCTVASFLYDGIEWQTQSVQYYDNTTNTYALVNFVTDEVLPAQTGFLRLSSGDALNFRNNNNSADINGISKDSGDVVHLGGTAGAVFSGQVQINTIAPTPPLNVGTNTTAVPSLNASLLLGSTWASPPTLGSTTPGAAILTSAQFNSWLQSGLCASAAVSGSVRLCDTDTVKFRNHANSADVIGLQKNSSDVVQVGDSAGTTFSGVITSTVAQGTSPFTIASTTLIGSLNAQWVNGCNFTAALGGGTCAITASTGTFSGAVTASRFTVVGGTGGINAQASYFSQEFPNDNPGTGNNLLVQYSGSFSGATSKVATVTAGALPAAAIGICTTAGGDTCGNSGTAEVVTHGITSCVFDAAITQGDLFSSSISVNGDCHDTGVTANIGTTPSSAPGVMGVILSPTNASAGTYVVFVFGPTRAAFVSGTATLATGTIATLACATPVTVAATGATTSSVISWSYASQASAANYGKNLVIAAYPTSGNVNFEVCNPSATNPVTPGAMTLNWRVMQ